MNAPGTELARTFSLDLRIEGFMCFVIHSNRPRHLPTDRLIGILVRVADHHSDCRTSQLPLEQLHCSRHVSAGRETGKYSLFRCKPSSSLTSLVARDLEISVNRDSFQKRKMADRVATSLNRMVWLDYVLTSNDSRSFRLNDVAAHARIAFL